MITDKTPCESRIIGAFDDFVNGGDYLRVNHHEFRHLETKKEYGDWSNEPAKVIQRYYCIFCGEILEKEDS